MLYVSIGIAILSAGVTGVWAAIAWIVEKITGDS